MIELDGWDLRPAEPSALPQAWRPIAEATDPGARRTAALALWPADFLALTPEFAQRLHDRLTDVQPCLAGDEPVLIYQAEPAVWVGRDPRDFAGPPAFWDRLPRPAQDFQRTVHSAFTFPDRESYGLMHPAHQRTIAELARKPAGIPGWDEAAAARPGGRIASTRLLRITRDSGNLLFCVSPDLPEGQVATVFEGDIEPEDFGPAFDDLLVMAFEET